MAKKKKSKSTSNKNRKQASLASLGNVSPIKPSSPETPRGEPKTPQIPPDSNENQHEELYDASKIPKLEPMPSAGDISPISTDTTAIKSEEDIMTATSEFDKLADELDDDANVEIAIPQKSIARTVEPDSAELLEATHETVQLARPIEISDGTQLPVDDGEFDPDLYFSGSDDEIVTAFEPSELKEEDPPSGNLAQKMPLAEHPPNTTLPVDLGNAEDDNFDFSDNKETTAPGTPPQLPIDAQRGDELETPREPTLSSPPPETLSPSSPSPIRPESTTKTPQQRTSPQHAFTQKGMIRQVSAPNLRHQDDADLSPLHSPVGSPRLSPEAHKKHNAQLDEYLDGEDDADGENMQSKLVSRGAFKRRGKPPSLVLDSPELLNPVEPNLSPRSNQHPAPNKRLQNLMLDSPSSPYGSPRPYKYTQSPVPKIDNDARRDPPIFGVCVVGFHHQRGPEVEYWVGPDRSHSKIWPYLPFQSLPDGSHQFEENICYFTLLYDRNKRAATSLTFDRDENGNIKEGTSDFRNVTTLFAIACSRQANLDDLEKVGSEEEYTRTVVQKSVVVIASKPIFGPIKEKLAVVTRSYFQQKNFMDRSIIDHFYENMMQMPMWINENDLQVGMNLQRFVHDFGVNVLMILKAMLLELKILFYAQDTDVLGTTQFALISLIPNLISHLEDSGSPLLSSYELHLRTPQSYTPGDRPSLLEYMNFPLQLFAAGGLFAPFVPLQQFDELRKPETRYGLMGTTNNLFLGTEIDFDVVVNIDTKEVQVRNPHVAPMLKLSDPDVAFINNIQTAVNRAWDTEETWQPEALGYYGGEDYIRHEFEEYLLALLASAKYARLSSTQLAEQQRLQEEQKQSSDDGTKVLSPKKGASNPAIDSQLTNEDGSFVQLPDAIIPDASPVKIRDSISPWNKTWMEQWMQTSNNFRIFDQHTVTEVFKATERAHPGLKYIKPSGFARFLGLFKGKAAPPSQQLSTAASSSASASTTVSPTSSVVHTPTTDQHLARFEPQTPQHLTFSAFSDSER